MSLNQEKLTQRLDLLHSCKGSHVDARRCSICAEAALVAPPGDLPCLKPVLKVCQLGIDLVQGPQRLRAAVEGLQVPQQALQILPAPLAA